MTLRDEKIYSKIDPDGHKTAILSRGPEKHVLHAFRDSMDTSKITHLHRMQKI